MKSLDQMLDELVAALVSALPDEGPRGHRHVFLDSTHRRWFYRGRFFPTARRRRTRRAA